MKAIYLDHAATTPMRPEALEAYAAAARRGPGNPSSLHAYGREARSVVTGARDRLAAALGCRPEELVFTSGGTESDNAALYGAAWAQRLKTGRTGVVTTAVEHHAVLKACRKLEEEGFALTVLPADGDGRVSTADAESAIDGNTAVVSVMFGNNEVGTLQPVAEIGELAAARGALMHTDAVQALGYVDLRLDRLPVDFASFSAHKLGGPQGVGALYIRQGAPFRPLLAGGSQERGRRAGTENVAGIAAFAAAAEAAASAREEAGLHAARMRERLLEGLTARLGPDGVLVNGNPARGLPHILNVSFPGISADTMLMNLDLAGVAASSGSACTSGSLQPSHVLAAMGLPPERIRSAVRFSFGLGNTIEEADEAVKIIATIAARLRNK